MNTNTTRRITVFTLLALPAAAFAHTGTEAHNHFTNGMLHPLASVVVATALLYAIGKLLGFVLRK